MPLTNPMKRLTHEGLEKARQLQIQQAQQLQDVKAQARRRRKTQLTRTMQKAKVVGAFSPTPAPTSEEAPDARPSLHPTAHTDTVAVEIEGGGPRFEKTLEGAEEEEEDPSVKKHPVWHHDSPGKAKARYRIYDSTKERSDAYSGLEVGTRFRHLHFGDRKTGGRFDTITVNFTHYVDLDINDYEKLILGRFLRDVLISWTFRTFILLVVIANAVLIGLTTDVHLYDKYKVVFEIVDQIILSIFIFELVIKWKYGFRIYWLVGWNILDFLILVFIASASVLPASVNQRAILALVRVVRALRSLRSVSSLKALIVVSHTIAKSTLDMANILFVLIIFMVVLAIAGVTLFDDAAFKTKRFLDCLDAWFVCFICVTQDGWIEVLDSFRGVEVGNFALISCYLIIAVIVGAFVFANLIVAVVVANLEEAIRGLKADKNKNENPLVYRDEFSPNQIEVVPVYAPFRTAPTSILRQRPYIAPLVPTPCPPKARARRLYAYQMAIVALEQNMLEHSIIEDDFRKVLGVMLGILQQMEKRELSLDADARREQALRDLQAYSRMSIPTDLVERAKLHRSFSELKGGGRGRRGASGSVPVHSAWIILKRDGDRKCYQ